MKFSTRRFLTCAAITAITMLTACSQQEIIDAEIHIPVMDGNTAAAYNTAVAEIADIEETQNVGGSIGYVYADTLYTEFESNIIEYCVTRGQTLKEGDVIAVFDSSALNYDYTSQKILTDDAYAKYMASGSEAARLEYEIQAKELELMQYKIDQYTIRAPYDCIVTGADSFAAGAVIPFGTKICTIAKEGEIYLYTSKSTDLFKVGMAVKARFGTNDFYSGRVVMTPGGDRGGRTERGSVNINECVTIKLDDGELERLISEVDNVITAGWATIVVPTVQKYNVLTLPEDAVATFSGSTYCSILNNGLQTRIPVEVEGIYNGLAVIRSGLDEGDEVIY